MAENKTKATDASVEDYLATIIDEARRKDCLALTALMETATTFTPKMWGSSIVGFGSYHYRYESGREGNSCLVGFASRKSDITVYGLNAAPDHEQLIVRLGKLNTGKGCLYIKRLSDIDLAVLKKLVAGAAAAKAHEHC